MRIGRSCRFEALLWLAAAVASPAGAVNNGTVQGGLSHQQWPVGRFLDPSQFPPFLNGANCSAVLIAPEWVLTAGVCVPYVSTSMSVAFYVPIDGDGCGAPGGQVAEAYTDPSGNVQLIRLGNTCGLHFTPFILNDGPAPVAGTTLYDLGWGGASLSGGAPLTGTTTVTAMPGLAANEIAFTGTNLFCSGSGDDGGPHFAYAGNGFPLAYAIFDRSDAACAQYNISVRMDALIGFITSHVSTVCLASNPTGPNCDGLFRDSLEPPRN